MQTIKEPAEAATCEDTSEHASQENTRHASATFAHARSLNTHSLALVPLRWTSPLHTTEQLLQLAHVLLASNCPLSREGIAAIRLLEVHWKYPGMLVPLDNAAYFSMGCKPFEEPMPLGVSKGQWLKAPPGLCYILKEGLIRRSLQNRVQLPSQPHEHRLQVHQRMLRLCCF